MTEILERELSHAVLGCAFAVHNELGSGFLERVYQNALAHELRKRGLHAEVQRPIAVYYDGVLVGEYYADIVVEGKMVLELKACERITPVHEAQLLHYLKATGFTLGYILNFGAGQKLEYRRMVWSAGRHGVGEGS